MKTARNARTLFVFRFLSVISALFVVWAWSTALALPASAQEPVTPSDLGKSAEERRAEKIKELQKRAEVEKARLKAEARAKQAPDAKPESGQGQEALSGDSARQKQGETFTLFPGESVTYQGVTVSWKAPSGKLSSDTLSDTTGTQTPLRYLTVVGPKSRMERVDLAEMSKESLGLYIDGVSMSIEAKDFLGRKEDLKPRLAIYAARQPSRFRLTGAPNSASWYLSAARPIEIDEWRFSVSEKPIRYSGDYEYFQVLGENASTGEKIEMPATPDAIRRFGRFQVRIDRFFPPTRTVLAKFLADPDPTAKGHDAYVAQPVEIRSGQTAKEFFEGLGKKYGFTVEWVENPKGNPESVAYAQETETEGTTSIDPGPPWSNGAVSGVVERVLGTTPRASGQHRFWPLGAEWADATHLRLWALDYDKVLENKQREAKKAAEREEELRYEAAEREKHEAARRDAEKRRDQEKERLVALFKKDYQLATQVYPLRHISATAAKTLADDLVDVYHLQPTDDVEYDEKAGRYVGTTFENTEGFFSITPERVLRRAGRTVDTVPLMSAKEQAIADERSNSLIVTAIPATHKKIAEMIARMDGVIADTAKESAPELRRFRVEVILLRGGKNGEAASLAADPSSKAKELRERAEKLLWDMVSFRTPRNDRVLRALLMRAYDNLSRAGEIEHAAGGPSPESRKLRLEAETTVGGLADKGVPAEEELRTVGSLLERARTLETSPTLQVSTSSPAIPSVLDKDEAARRYGIRPEDLDMFGLTQVSEEGRTVVELANDPGEIGHAAASLAGALVGERRCELQFQDLREPYLIVKARLVEGPAEGGTGFQPVDHGRPLPRDDAHATPGANPDSSDPSDQSDRSYRPDRSVPPPKVLIENTLFLKPGEPSVLGVTNLREALILVVRWNDLRPAKPAATP